MLGTAVAGATAKRLGADAGIAETLTADALVRRDGLGQLGLDDRTVVVVDEAGMADTRRLAELVEATGRARAKLVLVGDQAQLSPLAAGGLFAELAGRVPTAELSEVHRAREDWERDAWADLRGGEAERALAEYRARDRLHLSDTRVDAGEEMVSDWAQMRSENPSAQTVMLTDASNSELDRLNALAQAERARAGELGQRRARLADRPYTLAAGDEVLFSGQLPQPGAERVENGTAGEVLSVDERSQRVRVRTVEPEPRDVEFSTGEFSEVRLAYAQHVYKAQGLTVDRALVLSGGWQTDRERAYVALTRARERTDIYLAREEVGEEGLDDDAIVRLAARISTRGGQDASVTRAKVHAPAPGVDAARSEVGRALEAQREHERQRQRDRSHGIE